MGHGTHQQKHPRRSSIVSLELDAEIEDEEICDEVASKLNKLASPNKRFKVTEEQYMVLDNLGRLESSMKCLDGVLWPDGWEELDHKVAEGYRAICDAVSYLRDAMDVEDDESEEDHGEVQ